MMKKQEGKQQPKLFEGEAALVCTAVVGFVLATCMAGYMMLFEVTIPPEGDAQNVFSFNAAFGIFVLSVAALLPLAGMTGRRRRVVRWMLVFSTLLSYIIETVQNLRGINPRFTQEGTVIDQLLGGFFGLLSLIIVTVTVLITIAFFRNKDAHQRPMLVLSARYAFISTMIANAAGVSMIVLQGRYFGDAGNLIVLHGLGYHALQALPLMGWLLEQSSYDEEKNSRPKNRRLIHIGSMAWLVSIGLILLQSAWGRSVFEFSLLPVLAGASLLIWFGLLLICVRAFVRRKPVGSLQSAHEPENPQSL